MVVQATAKLSQQLAETLQTRDLHMEGQLLMECTPIGGKSIEQKMTNPTKVRAFYTRLNVTKRN